MARNSVSHFRPELLRAVRREAGWTATALANAVGRHRSQIARWELGEETPGVEVIRSLAQVLEVSPDRLAPLPSGRPLQLADLRVAALLTQAEAARGLGIAHPTYVRIERGVTRQVSDDRIAALATLFNVDRQRIVEALNVWPQGPGRSKTSWSLSGEHGAADGGPLVTMGTRPDGRRWVITVEFGAGVRIDESGKIRDRAGAHRAWTPAEARERAGALEAAARWIESGRTAQLELSGE